MRHAFLLLLAVFVQAADHPLGGRLSFDQHAALAAQLSLAEPQKRMAAVVRLRADGRDALTAFSARLSQAEDAALASLRRVLASLRPADSSIEAIRSQLAEYQRLSGIARTLVQTDHHKNAKKFAEMDRAFADAQNAHKKISRALKPGTATPAVQFLDALAWAAEIRRSQRWCEGKDAPLAALPFEAVMETEGAAPELKVFVKECAPFLSLREYHRATAAAHAQMRWAHADHVAFAKLLNERREIIGLPPLLLAEKLTAACWQHSEEMAKLKYFSHESPVRANKTFGDRVKNAGFAGGAGGECIYSGGGAATAAHTAWWYSDGHRLILYASKASAQGISHCGGLWTFLLGSFAPFPM